MTAITTKKESINFLYFAIKRVWMAAGASEEHAHYVAHGITFAHKQGKLNQPIRIAVAGIPAGAGLYETLVLLGKEKSIERIRHAADTLAIVPEEAS